MTREFLHPFERALKLIDEATADGSLAHPGEDVPLGCVLDDDAQPTVGDLRRLVVSIAPHPMSDLVTRLERALLAAALTPGHDTDMTIWSEPGNVLVWAELNMSVQKTITEITRLTSLLDEARGALKLARNRLQACAVAAVAAGLKDHSEWSDWATEANEAVSRATLTKLEQPHDD